MQTCFSNIDQLTGLALDAETALRAFQVLIICICIVCPFNQYIFHKDITFLNGTITFCAYRTYI